MKQIPKHAELIKQWADGATIQWHDPDDKNLGMVWQDCHNNLPAWSPRCNYRVKPEPKPDVVLYAMIEAVPEFGSAKIRSVQADVHKIKSDTCMFVFDGETGELKDAQVLAKE